MEYNELDALWTLFKRHIPKNLTLLEIAYFFLGEFAVIYGVKTLHDILNKEEI